MRIGKEAAARARIDAVAAAPDFDMLSPEGRQSLEAQVPFLPRLGTPDNYAKIAGRMADHAMLNGLAIRRDGAFPGAEMTA